MRKVRVGRPHWWYLVGRRFCKRVLLHVASAMLFHYGILSNDWKSIWEIRREARRVGIGLGDSRLYYVLERLVFLGVLEKISYRRRVYYRVRRGVGG